LITEGCDAQRKTPTTAIVSDLRQYDIRQNEVELFRVRLSDVVDQTARAMKDAEMEAEIEDFLEGFKQPTWRRMRINGERVPVWSSRKGWSGM
jgi:hypothetical protein